jgi:hypothetical protein
MEITTEMLDVIEKLKGKRNPALWDPRCAQFLEEKSKGSVKTAVKQSNNS